MHNSIMYFSYAKMSDNGQPRNAYGTLDQELIAFHGGTPNGNSPNAARTPNPETVQYFDLEKMAWRSFRKDNFLDILEDTV